MIKEIALAGGAGGCIACLIMISVCRFRIIKLKRDYILFHDEEGITKLESKIKSRSKAAIFWIVVTIIALLFPW